MAKGKRTKHVTSRTTISNSAPSHGLIPGPAKVRRAEKLTRTPEQVTAWEHAETILQQHKSQLLAIQGVVAVEVAPSLVHGKPINTPCIRIHVYRKRSRDALSPDEIIPERIDGVHTDIVPASFCVGACRSVAKPLFRRWPRLQGGITIGRQGDRSIATIGALFLPIDQDDTAIGLTAGHAFRIGDVVTQPTGGSAADAIGKVLDVKMSNEIDAAVIEVDHSRRPLMAGVAGAGGPVALRNLRQDGDYAPVLMTGGCSGWQVGWARRSSEPIPINYPHGQVWMKDHIHITSGNGNIPFNRGGDSGALLLSHNGEFAYGLVIAVGEFEGNWLGIATPIDRIAKHFSLRIAV